jgi:hypothetical protein
MDSHFVRVEEIPGFNFTEFFCLYRLAQCFDGDYPDVTDSGPTDNHIGIVQFRLLMKDYTQGSPL